jgi:hypothetical protein
MNKEFNMKEFEMHEVFFEDFLPDIPAIQHDAEKERRRKKMEQKESYRDVKFSSAKTKKKRRFFSFGRDEEY